MDVKKTLLNDMIEEDVYIEYLEGFDTFNKESHVCRLKRVMYGLKQATRVWYTKSNIYFTWLGFTESEVDANLYQLWLKVDC